MPMQSKPARQRASTVRVPAPVKGIDGKNPLSMMDPLSSIAMTNAIPRTNGVAYRNGSKINQTGLVGFAERVIPYIARVTSNNKLFTSVGGSIYDVTSPGGTPALVYSGLTNNKWNYVNFGTQAAQNLVLCNGIDPARVYNGGSWTVLTQVFVAPSAYGQVQGISPSLLENVTVHQKRLWFTERDTARIWYFPIDSVGGVAQSLDLSGYLINGGKIIGLASWTTDAGRGTDDHLVAFSSNGDVVVFEGTDPSNVSTWSLLGTWTIGRPIGNDFVEQYGSDLLVLTVDGVIELKRAILGARLDIEAVTSDSISTILNELIQLFGDLDGWQVIVSPEEKLVIVNVPQIDRNQNFQFVMDTTLKSWATIRGFPAQHWCRLNGKLYFGANGKVIQGFASVFLDNVNANGTGGTQYEALIHAAYSNFRTPTSFKLFSLVRPIFQSATPSPAIQAAIKTDFSLQDIFGATLPGVTVTTGLWDTARFDQSVWSGATVTVQQWVPVIGSGYNASILLKIVANGELYWVATDWLYEVGGTL